MSDVKSLFKAALLQMAQTGELREMAGMGWVTEERAEELERGLLDIEGTFHDAEGNKGIQAMSFIGLLGPLADHEPVLADALYLMVRFEAEEARA